MLEPTPIDEQNQPVNAFAKARMWALGEPQRQITSLCQRALAPAIVTLLVVQSGIPTHAAFPGMNGQIGFSDVTNGKLFTIAPDGGLAEIPGGVGPYISWSPDGHRVAFATSPGPGEKHEIYVVNVDGTALARLTFFAGTDEEPSWSPDGTKIVWQRQCDIWMMNADGGDQHNVTQTPGICAPLEAQEFHPKWSPDGTRISFESYRDGPLNIFTMDPDGGGIVNVSQGSHNDFEADWSPDSSKIVFRSTRDGSPGDIYVMDADGGNQTRLTTTPSAYKHDPVWSPDGTRIAFIGIRGNRPGDFSRLAIFTMNPDGTDVRLVIKTQAQRLDWQAMPGPDLVESAISTPPTHVAPGGTFILSDTVLNQGDAGAGGSRTRYYLSFDDVKSPDDTALSGSRVVAAIPAGESLSGAVTVKIPATMPLGTYTLFACADALRNVNERDESNNCVAADGQVTIAMPDLQQVSISSPPAQAVPGAQFTVSDTVQNPSLVTIVSTTTRYHLSEDTIKSPDDVLLVGKRSVAALSAGGLNAGSAKVTVPSSMTTGQYYLLACADDLNKANETDETNNCAASTTSVVIDSPNS